MRMAGGSGHHLRCQEEGAMRGNAGCGGAEGDRLADTGLELGGKLGQAHGASSPASHGRSRTSCGAARPSPTEDSEGRRGCHSLTWLVT